MILRKKILGRATKNEGSKVNNDKKLHFIFRDQLLGFLFGTIFSGLLSGAVWLFAYFGYINLGLPQRYDYERISHIINKELPSNYSYRSIPIENFRQSDTKSILIIGTHNDFGGSTFNPEVGSDLLLILDKSKLEYKVTYKFQPDTEHPMHVRQMYINDITDDNRPEILIGWSELGAHWSNTFLSVFGSDGVDIKIFGSPKLSNIEYPPGFKSEKIVNKFNNAEHVSSFRSEYFTSKKGVIATINRTHEACYACAEEELWYVNYLHFWDWDSALHDTGDYHEGIKGIKNLEEILKSDGYEWN